MVHPFYRLSKILFPTTFLVLPKRSNEAVGCKNKLFCPLYLEPKPEQSRLK